MPSDAENVTEDRLLGGAVRLRQRRGGHRAGTDAVLLAGLCEAREGAHVVDLGSASGAVGLMLAARLPGLRVTLVERDADEAALARENAALNGWADRITVHCLDVFSPSGGWPIVEPADLVVTNPPFFDAGADIRVSPNARRAAAHVMEGGGLSDWLAAAARFLKPRGRLALIHRADALETCLAALRPSFGSPVILPIQARANREASRILLRAVRGGRAPLALLPPLVLHEADGTFTPETARLHASGEPQGSGTKAAR